MTIAQNLSPTTSSPIAAHRYVLPIVRKIASVAAAPRDKAPAPNTFKVHSQAAATERRPPVGELERAVMAASLGDRTAMSDLVERFAPRVRAVARAHRLAAHDVEDVMQTTWLRLLQRVDTVRNPSALGSWLETTARRESLRVLKANSRERPTNNEAVFDALAPPVDEQPLKAAGLASLAVVLERLSSHQRELLSMLFADPAPSYAEISRALGMPIGSIGPTRARCLRRLRENEHLGDVGDAYRRPWTRTSPERAL
jgi:RNA polymerase sigma factor (sigma-70 family)